jgi:cell division protein FtsI/penicillin-binding protein 2
MVVPYVQTLRSYTDLNRPLFGSYRFLRKEKNLQLEKHLAAGFYPPYGYGYGRSQAFRQAASQGSIFKMVTAYEALVQHYNSATPSLKSNLNPLDMEDTVFKLGKETFVGYTAEGKAIPRFYKGGRLPRSLSSRLGKMDLLRAIETSSNPYFSLLAGDILKSPEDLAKAAKLFSHGAKTGIDMPAEITGKVPQDLSQNRTGLYSTAIGQHTLVVTPLQTSVMLSALANGGRVLKPKIISLKAGRKSSVDADEVVSRKEFVYQDSLALVGIDFPFFTAVAQRENKHTVQKMPTVVQRELFMPAEIRKTLLEGMRRVVVKSYADSLMGLSKIYRQHPEAINDYVALKEELLGKSSTAEAIENLGLDHKVGSPMVNHVWFGGIAFDKTPSTNKKTFLFRDTEGVPELVVVVYLKYGGYGKEAAPLAAQVVKKWREIKQKKAKNS